MKQKVLKKSICSCALHLTASCFFGEISGYCSEGADRDRSLSGDSGGLRFRPSRRMYSQQSTQDQDAGLPWIAETVTTEITEIEINPEVTTIIHSTDITEDTIEANKNIKQEEGFLGVPTLISASGSADTLVPSAPTSPSNLSNITLMGSTGSVVDKSNENENSSSTPFKYGIAPIAPLTERGVPKRPPRTIEQQAAAIFTESITTLSQSQLLPQQTTSMTTTTTTIKSSVSESLPSIIKIAPPPTVSMLNANMVTITTSTLFSSPSASSTTTKTSITTPSIGVSFDR